MDPAVLAALNLSVRVGAWCTVLGMPPAVALGLWLARSRSRLKPVVSTLAFLPLVVPPVVTGLVLLEVLGRNGAIGGALASVGLAVPFTFAAAVIAALVVGFPLYVMAARSAFEAVDPRYEEVSRAHGVPPAWTFVRVTLPLSLPGLGAGAVLSFARALGEFGATIVLAGNTEATRTIPIAVYALLDQPGGDRSIWPLVSTSVAVSALALVGFEMLQRWQRRRLEIDR